MNGFEYTSRLIFSIILSFVFIVGLGPYLYNESKNVDYMQEKILYFAVGDKIPEQNHIDVKIESTNYKYNQYVTRYDKTYKNITKFIYEQYLDTTLSHYGGFKKIYPYVLDSVQLSKLPSAKLLKNDKNEIFYLEIDNNIIIGNKLSEFQKILLKTIGVIVILLGCIFLLFIIIKIVIDKSNAEEKGIPPSSLTKYNGIVWLIKKIKKF